MKKTTTKRQVGYWVVFDEPNEAGVIPDGFYTTSQSIGVGYRKHHLVPCYIDVPKAPP